MSTVQEQSQELAKRIWAICNALRGSVDANDFKDYILGVIFYRYLSERTERYVNELLENEPTPVTYEAALDGRAGKEIRDAVLDMCYSHLGYVIETKYLWRSLIAKIKHLPPYTEADKFSIEDFEKATSKLVESTVGRDSEFAFHGLFDGMNLRSEKLGRDVASRTDLVRKALLGIDNISFGFDEASMDVLGTAYMILIGLFQDSAGKKGGEFFTPTCVSVLLARLATLGMKEVRNVSDLCAGSGSLLLEVQKHLPAAVGCYWAQESNPVTYNLLRMNLIIHDVPYAQFRVFNDDSIVSDNFYSKGSPVLVDVAVSNPPYSAKYTPTESLSHDPRYSSAGAMAPKARADLAFVESMAYHMSENGRVAVLLPSGALCREGTEQTIRRYLVSSLNCVDAVIGLPSKMFHGTDIAVCILFLKRNRNGDSRNIFFIDGSKFFVAKRKKNEMSEDDIQKILDLYSARKSVEGMSAVVSVSEVVDKSYDINFSTYIKVKNNTSSNGDDVETIEEILKDIDQIENDRKKERDNLMELIKNLETL